MKIPNILLVALTFICTVGIVNAAITNINGPPSSLDVTSGDTFNLTWEMDLSVSNALVVINIPSFSSDFTYTPDSFTAKVDGTSVESSFDDASSSNSIAIGTDPGSETLPDLPTGHLILTIPFQASSVSTVSHPISWTLTTGDSETFPFQTKGTTTVTISVKNNAPTLSNGSATPDLGGLETIFTYEVTYTDIDNDPPSLIQVIIDGNKTHGMNAKAGQDGDYTNGEIYEYNTTGAALGYGNHTYQFSASDGTNSATGDTGIHIGPDPPLKGDINRDGKVDIEDATMVAYMVVGKIPADPEADFNGNGRVDIGDAAKIMYYLAGKVSDL